MPNYIKTLPVSHFKLKSPRESGKTFKENSLLKSFYFSKRTGLICLADDSGLEIDLLNKRPGIYSARWGGKKSDFNKAIRRVYSELNKKDKNWKKKEKLRLVLFALYLCVFLKKKIACVQGKVEGYISKIPKGKNGFGYDPIFIPLKKKMTFGEMKPKLKCKIDHRFKAFKKIKKFL